MGQVATRCRQAANTPNRALKNFIASAIRVRYPKGAQMEKRLVWDLPPALAAPLEKLGETASAQSVPEILFLSILVQNSVLPVN